MLSLVRMVVAVAAVWLALACNAYAGGGKYVFDGGTRAQQSEVSKGLNASAFNWTLVPATITIHIGPSYASAASYGEIWLNAAVLDSGRFSWGVIQHEYAHQVDFFLLDDSRRAQLVVLGGKAWWATGTRVGGAPNGTLAHEELTAERFASTLAWAYWQSPANSMRPSKATDESAAMAPKPFRALLSSLLGRG
jgi:hypothetical protein